MLLPLTSLECYIWQCLSEQFNAEIGSSSFKFLFYCLLLVKRSTCNEIKYISSFICMLPFLDLQYSKICMNHLE